MAIASEASASPSLEVFTNSDGVPSWSSQPITGPSYGSPAMVRFLNHDTDQTGTLLANTGADGSLNFYYNVDGTSTWGSSQVAASGIYSPPAMVRYRTGTLLAAAQATGGSLNFYSNIDGDPTWTSSQIAAAGAPTCAPAMVRNTAQGTSGTLVADSGTDGSLNFYYNVDGTSTWGSSQVAVPGTTCGCPAMVRNSAGTLLAAVGTDGSLNFYYNVDGNPNWNTQKIAAAGTTACDAPAMVRFTNSQVGTLVTSTGTDASLTFYYNVDGQSNWNSTQIAGPGSTESGPAMVREETNKFGQDGTLVTAARPDGSVYFYYNVDGVPSFTASQIAGPGTSYSAPAMVRTGETVTMTTGTEVAIATAPPVRISPLNNTPGSSAFATWLMQDGSVLALLGDFQTLSRLTPDVHGSYLNGTWSPAGSLLQSHQYFASQVLSNGNLAICGGEFSSAGNETNFCEIYNPFTQTSSVLAPPPGWVAIGDSPSTLLPNGTMFIGNTQGSGFQSAILNPSTLSWTFVTGDASAEQGYALLQTGDVLTTNVFNLTSKRYSPGSTGFVNDANVPVTLGAGSEIGPAMTLANGKLIWFGATGLTAIYTPTSAGHNGSWVAGPNLPVYQNEQLVASDDFAVLEPTGRVLLTVAGANTGSQLAEYDPTPNTIALVGKGVSPVNFATQASPLLLLPTGEALFAPFNGGWFDVSFSGPTLSAPAITSFPPTVSRGTTVTLSGKQLCGLSEVSMMGDDNQQAENYPIVRVVGTSGTTRYLRAHDVSTRSIAPNQAATVSVDVPSNLAPGSYSLTVVATGIPSSAVSVQVQ